MIMIPMNIIIWLVIIALYCAMSACVYMYVCGYSAIHGRSWKQVYPNKVDDLVLVTRVLGVLVVVAVFFLHA